MRKWVTTLPAIAAVVAAGAASLTALAPAGAATHRVSHAPAAMRKQLAALVARGATDAQIRQATGLRRVGSVGRTPMSTLSAVTVSTPAMYYDSLARYYYTTATWNFTKSPPDGDEDGQDGFGVTFSRQINNIGGSLYVCMKKGSTTTTNCQYADNYASNDAYGAGWTFSNFSFGGTLFAAGHGSMVFAFKRLDSSCLQAFTKYAHSWSSTSVTGLSVGIYSIGVTWKSSGHQWTKASAAGKLGC